MKILMANGDWVRCFVQKHDQILLDGDLNLDPANFGGEGGGRTLYHCAIYRAVYISPYADVSAGHRTHDKHCGISKSDK